MYKVLLTYTRVLTVVIDAWRALSSVLPTEFESDLICEYTGAGFEATHLWVRKNDHLVKLDERWVKKMRVVCMSQGR